MVELKKGSIEYANVLPQLIYDSASSVLDFIFNGKSNALTFLKRAAKESEGQFSVNRHHFACLDGNPVGCVSLWHTELPASFHTATYTCLERFLHPDLLQHVIRVNPSLLSTFAPPKDFQLCFGHFCVKEEFRGENIGSKLLAHVTRKGNQLLKQELALDVEVSNEAALQVYERWGFVVKSEKTLEPINQTFYRMTKSL